MSSASLECCRRPTFNSWLALCLCKPIVVLQWSTPVVRMVPEQELHWDWKACAADHHQVHSHDWPSFGRQFVLSTRTQGLGCLKIPGIFITAVT
jgi:hypothetical protein